MNGAEYKTRIEQFITEGFVKVENAFSTQIAKFPAKQFQLNRIDGNYNPVEIAIRRGLGLIRA